jgi:predicted ribosomally synthesized peptide with SipW-like signal peptide
MGSHVAGPTAGRWFGGRWFGRGRTRALLCLGVLAALGATSTSAYWTDEATVTSGSISSATLDLTAGPSTGSEFLTGTGPNNWTYSALTLTDMVPAESVSTTVVVRNSGTAPLRFNATVRSTTNDLTSASQGLQVVIFDNSSAGTQTGTQAAGNRAGPCTGGTQVFSGFVSTTASANVLPSDVPLATAGATRSLCIQLVLDASAPNSLQGKTTTIVLSLSAAQLP